MPEGPEVTRMTERVREMMLNVDVIKIERVFGNVKEKGLSNIQSALPLRVTDVNNNGKLMWFVFESLSNVIDPSRHCKWWLIVTFGLDGGWCKDPKHSYNRLVLQGINDTKLYYKDKLNYGSLTFTNDPIIFHTRTVVERGFNLFGKEELSLDYFTELLKSSKKEQNICDFIYKKQNILSGIGNYLKCEILYFSRISPWRSIKKLSQKEIELLHYYIVEICKRSYVRNGRTNLYSDLFTADECTFDTQFMVYNKQKDPLDYKVTHEKTPDESKTYWVKELQY
jgi:formamidopyrimidine-DNA glycosylase